MKKKPTLPQLLQAMSVGIVCILGLKYFTRTDAISQIQSPTPITESRHTTAYTPTETDTTPKSYIPPIQTDCTKFATKLPEKFDIFATGAYSGKKTVYQIDDSGHQATSINVKVKHPNPTVLMLGAYEPTLWNIEWEKNTDIVGVVVTGYHHQVVLGLPKSVPLLVTTSDNSQCGYSYVSDNNAQKMNRLSQEIMQRDIQAIIPAQNGLANIGDIDSTTSFTSSNDTTLDDVIDKNAPLAGRAGIEDAVAKGLLRPATQADIQAWLNEKASIFSSAEELPYVHLHSSYVVLKAMTIPAGLYGGNSVTFFVPKGIPRPTGNLGHSEIYDFNTKNCTGSSPSCN